MTCVNLSHYADNSVMEDIISKNNIEVVCSGGQSPFYLKIKKIFDDARTYSPEIITVLGGGVITAEPELIYKMMSPTYGVIGEGEETIVELMEAVESNRDVSKVKGIIYRDRKGVIIKNGDRDPIADIDQIPFPDFDGFEVEKYFEHQMIGDSYLFHTLEQPPRSLPIISSRGCPFQCTFCFHPIGKKYRQRSLDNFFEELELLISKYRINYVDVFDELFTVEKKRVYEFCERIKPYRINWATQMRVNTVDEETLKLLKESGCTCISYGIESASNTVLKSMKKAITVEEINRALELTKKAGITIQGNLIVGDPGETIETIRENVEWLNKHPEYDIAFGNIMIYPGSELYFRAIEKGFIKNKEDFLEMGGGVFNLTKISDDQFYKLTLLFEVETRNSRMKKAGKIVSMKRISTNKLKGDICDFKAYCPHCKYLNEYRAFNILYNGIEQSKQMVCKNCLQKYHVFKNLFFAKVLYKLTRHVPENLGVFVFNVTSRLLSLKHGTAKDNRDGIIRYIKRMIKK